jgi:hypothetical protein
MRGLDPRIHLLGIRIDRRPRGYREEGCSNASGRYPGQGSGVSVLPSKGAPGFVALIKRVRKVTAVENIEFFCALWLERNRVAGIPSRSSCCMRPRGLGAQMIIDLDSWEAGYADGRLGCGPACPEHHDEVSYSSGYREGRATRAGTRMKPPRLRRLQRFKGAFDPVG